MNVLDTFVHDPLVEWVEKRVRVGRTNEVVDVHALTQDALGPIKEKLQGIYRPLKTSQGKQLSTNNHVQALIQQASDPAYLVSPLALGPSSSILIVTTTPGTHVRRVGTVPLTAIAYIHNHRRPTVIYSCPRCTILAHSRYIIILCMHYV